MKKTCNKNGQRHKWSLCLRLFIAPVRRLKQTAKSRLQYTNNQSIYVPALKPVKIWLVKNDPKGIIFHIYCLKISGNYKHFVMITLLRVVLETNSTTF